MAERCPLCQGKLQNGECVSCGYRPPDEEDISALYNYDPSDYPQPQSEEEHIREITPEVQMEEIYPNRPEPIEIKVRDSQGKTIGQNGQNSQGSPYYQSGQNSPYGQQGQYGGNQGNPYYQNGQNRNSPYGQQGQGNPYYRSGNSPYGQQGQYSGNQGNPYYQKGNSPYNQKGSYNGKGHNKNQPIDNVKDLMKTYWWLALLCFAIPPFGIMSFIAAKNTIDKKYYWIFILLTVIGFFRFI